MKNRRLWIVVVVAVTLALAGGVFFGFLRNDETISTKLENLKSAFAKGKCGSIRDDLRDLYNAAPDDATRLEAARMSGDCAMQTKKYSESATWYERAITAAKKLNNNSLAAQLEVVRHQAEVHAAAQTAQKSSPSTVINKPVETQ